MKLALALSLSDQLKIALGAEIGRAREERRLLRTLDSAALLERAARREHFNAALGMLERQLVAELVRAAAALGLPEVSAEAFAARAGKEGTALQQSLAEIRALAAALAELDALNRTLAERTLKVVRSYTAALNPRPSAYDRTGARPRASSPSLTSARF